VGRSNHGWLPAADSHRALTTAAIAWLMPKQHAVSRRSEAAVVVKGCAFAFLSTLYVEKMGPWPW